MLASFDGRMDKYIWAILFTAGLFLPLARHVPKIIHAMPLDAQVPRNEPSTIDRVGSEVRPCRGGDRRRDDGHLLESAAPAIPCRRLGYPKTSPNWLSAGRANPAASVVRTG